MSEAQAEAAPAATDPTAGTEPPQGGAAPVEAQPPAEQPTTDAPHEGLAPFVDRLTPLLEADENGHTMLDGLLEFYELTGDENRVDEFEEWWDAVGKSYGFLHDDEPGPEDAPIDGEPAGDDPMAELHEKIAELEAKVNGTDEQSRLSQQEQKVQESLTTLMQQNGIEEDRSQPEEKWPSTRILRLALSYEGDIGKAVAEYLDLTGQAQQGLLNSAGEDTMDVSRLANGGAPGPSLRGGSPDMEPEPVGNWSDASKAARARFNGG